MRLHNVEEEGDRVLGRLPTRMHDDQFADEAKALDMCRLLCLRLFYKHPVLECIPVDMLVRRKPIGLGIAIGVHEAVGHLPVLLPGVG
jgi:hypothetical protein